MFHGPVMKRPRATGCVPLLHSITDYSAINKASHLKRLKSSAALLQKPQTSPTLEIPLMNYLSLAVPCIMAVLVSHGSAA
jgi:hypothetical protein